MEVIANAMCVIWNLEHVTTSCLLLLREMNPLRLHFFLKQWFELNIKPTMYKGLSSMNREVLWHDSLNPNA